MLKFKNLRPYIYFNKNYSEFYIEKNVNNCSCILPNLKRVKIK